MSKSVAGRLLSSKTRNENVATDTDAAADETTRYLGQAVNQPWEDDDRRSRYVRNLVHGPETELMRTLPDGRTTAKASILRVIVRFWHDRRDIPDDVRACLDSWNVLKKEGFRVLLFDDVEARRFVLRTFGHRYSRAYDVCHHPAMRCDYFRLCYILSNGGCYVDADDVYQGTDFTRLFCDSKMKVQALCYDVATDSMVCPDIFFGQRRSSPTWTFYVNNNPLVAPAGHRILRLALERATRILLSTRERPDIQSTTGPGNLTACLVRHAIATTRLPTGRDFSIMDNWDAIAVSRWPLSYRNDQRNWTLASNFPKRGC